jgi:Family of unknown function (DUF6452)
MKKLAWFLFLLIFTLSCLNEPDCYQLNNSSVILSFKILGAGKNMATIADLYQSLGIRSPATEEDTVFQNGKAFSSVELPLNPLEEQTTFFFDGVYGDNSIQIGYQRQVQFVSEDCGERYIYADLKILEYDFDSVRIVNPTPTAPASTNIEIYRCPRTNLVGVDFSEEVVLDGITTDFSAVIFQPTDTLSTIDLPINKDAASTTFVFDFRGAAPSKTLTLSYSRTAKTLSEICGEQILFSDLAVAATNFTSFVIKSDSTQDLPITNVEITP